MNQNQKEPAKEILTIVIAALFLGFLLALKFKWPIIIFEPFEFLIMFLLALLILGVFVGSQKLTANLLDCKTTTKLISFKRFWFASKRKISSKLPFTFPLWLIGPLLLFFITNGFLKWIAILDLDIKPKSTRVRKEFYALTEDEVGKITLIGPVAVLALAIISKAIGLSTGITGFTSFAVICSLFAFLSLIPFGIGFKLMVSSRLIWLFTLIFSFFMMLLMQFESLFAIIAVALLFAAIAVTSYYMFYEN